MKYLKLFESLDFPKEITFDEYKIAAKIRPEIYTDRELEQIVENCSEPVRCNFCELRYTLNEYCKCVNKSNTASIKIEIKPDFRGNESLYIITKLKDEWFAINKTYYDKKRLMNNHIFYMADQFDELLNYIKEI